jgi:predicted RNase H-like nuclease (RuvC/YqgF family)
MSESEFPLMNELLKVKNKQLRQLKGKVKSLEAANKALQESVNQFSYKEIQLKELHNLRARMKDIQRASSQFCPIDRWYEDVRVDPSRAIFNELVRQIRKKSKTESDLDVILDEALVGNI